jgi:hypothetical protein
MPSPADQLDRQHRPLAAHLAIAALAVAGAALVQSCWGEALHADVAPGWRSYIAATIAATTAWLGSAAWLHWRLTCEASEGRRTQAKQLILNAVSDLLVAAFAGFILREGHKSPVALAGLWLIPPTLLAVAAPSALVLLASAWGMRTAQSNDDELPQSDQSAVTSRLRTAIVVALFLALGGLASRPLPTSGSHPVDHDELRGRTGGP